MLIQRPGQGWHSAPAEIIETSTRRVRETELKEGKTLKHSTLADVFMLVNKEKNNLVKSPGFGRKQFYTAQDFMHHFQRYNSNLFYNFIIYSMEFCSPAYSQYLEQCDEKSTPLHNNRTS